MSCNLTAKHTTNKDTLAMPTQSMRRHKSEGFCDIVVEVAEGEQGEFTTERIRVLFERMLDKQNHHRFRSVATTNTKFIRLQGNPQEIDQKLVVPLPMR